MTSIDRTGITSPSSLSCHRSPNCLEHDSVLKNSFVPSSDPCSGAQNPGLVVFWPRFLDVLGLFCAADGSDSDFLLINQVEGSIAPPEKHQSAGAGALGPVPTVAYAAPRASVPSACGRPSSTASMIAWVVFWTPASAAFTTSFCSAQCAT